MHDYGFTIGQVIYNKTRNILTSCWLFYSLNSIVQSVQYFNVCCTISEEYLEYLKVFLLLKAAFLPGSIRNRQIKYCMLLQTYQALGTLNKELHLFKILVCMCICVHVTSLNSQVIHKSTILQVFPPLSQTGNNGDRNRILGENC